MLRTIFAGLKASFIFERSLIERVACDEVDREILQCLFEAGSRLLPRTIAVNLERFKVNDIK